MSRTVEVTVKKKGRLSAESDLELIDRYIGTLYMNGHILGQSFVVARAPRGYRFIVSTPLKDAMSARCQLASRHVKRALQALAEGGFNKPKVANVSCRPSAEGAGFCSCAESSYFILFTLPTAEESPVRCGDCFQSVPLYHLPPSPIFGEAYEEIGWKREFDSVDRIHTCHGTRFANRQLTDPESSLSQSGRGICLDIELRTGKAVYYVLYRQNLSGRNEGLVKVGDRCPSCNGKWKMKKPVHGVFGLVCKKCKLMSNTIDPYSARQ
jgi:predicted  nucleic acid-binding Zn ribbon protein